MNQRKNANSDIRYPQSAVIPFQLKKNYLKILLITSIKTKQWIFPKGIIEEHLTPQQSALQEALEEAGVEGEVLNISIGEYSYEKWGGICDVEIFPMHVTRVLDDWPEADLRKRKWVTINKAINLISKRELRDSLRKFEKNLNEIKSTISIKPK
jgi:8-oxo-dGTP pyrophosphatase MutT (NUDIX family)